jgi:hypothetical protein
MYGVLIPGFDGPLRKRGASTARVVKWLALRIVKDEVILILIVGG